MDRYTSTARTVELGSSSKRVRIRSYACTICASSRTTRVLVKRGLLIDAPFDIVRCEKCSHHYVEPRICDEDLESLYDDDYYRGRGFDRGIDFYAAPDVGLERSIGRIVTTLSSISAPRSGPLTWLDVGCGAGNLLAVVRARGANAYGYDLGQPARTLCAEKGIDVLDDGKLASMTGSFDVVTAIEVIEHVPDPRAFLRELIASLKIGGVLYVQTGNWHLVRLVRETPYLMPEGHIHYFSPRTMRRLFDELGLAEAPAVNPSWFGSRVSAGLPFDVSPIVRLAERCVRKVGPDYAQFPIGVRTR